MIQGVYAMQNLPQKLKRDAIVEALLEIQFEHGAVGDFVVGQLAAAPDWLSYHNVRLPFADFPAPLREADANLRYQPTFQLNRPTPGEIVKIGPRVISLHVLSPYPGWERFHERLQSLVEQLFSIVRNPHINRLGLRYLNALSPAHGFKSLEDLNFCFEVGSERPSSELTASYRFDPLPNVRAQVTLASPAFVVGVAAPGAVAFVDVDVSTPGPLGAVSHEKVLSWIIDAHDAEKQAFFALWPEEILNQMREE
jgi:uncharacterized protein (TIGR04255 family)